MTQITTSCHRCGRIDVTADDIDLRIDINAPDAAIYGFTCPSCTQIVVRSAGRRVVRLLVASGVPVRTYEAHLSAIRDPVIVFKNWAPITDDDLLDFHEALQDEAAITKFMSV